MQPLTRWWDRLLARLYELEYEIIDAPNGTARGSVELVGGWWLQVDEHSGVIECAS